MRTAFVYVHRNALHHVTSVPCVVTTSRTTCARTGRLLKRKKKAERREDKETGGRKQSIRGRPQPLTPVPFVEGVTSDGRGR
ncbi:hypothetical protein NDU88_004594 [Pleurodeles waltl]|uniref:Secreted protein n=1 Tax=Pleurodeles waltl TaxID=8319 RepID=A0AAV7PCY8_PLEWA|nr:hypothetical protein NDU88_004594 [Pleurodeles waltl]